MQTIAQAKIIVAVGALLTILTIIFMASFGSIYSSLLNKMLVIDPEGRIFKSFQSPSVPIYLDFYMFDVQNPEEIMTGATPIVVERGPYSYQETFNKDKFDWDDEKGTVSYVQNTTYVFVPERSNGTESDIITTLNAIMVIMGAMTTKRPLLRKLIWSEIEEEMELFENHTVGELIFEGYNLPNFTIENPATGNQVSGSIYDILDSIESIDKDPPQYLEDNKFGYFYMMNNTDDGLYTVNTGEQGMDEYLHIQKYNNNNTVDFWGSDECNMINGTDGTQFPPGVDKTATLSLFTMDLCRSIYVTFTNDTYMHDILPTYRFALPDEVLQSPDTNPDNECFCEYLPTEDSCLHDSMLNLAPCMGGAPIVMSTPHFYQGDDRDVAKIKGLDPQKELHETFLDIEPTTGVVAKAAKRIQMNLPLKKYGKLPSFQKVPDVIFPVLWASENAQLTESDAEKMNRVLTRPFKITYSICGAILAVGILMLIIGTVKLNKNKKHSQLISPIK